MAITVGDIKSLNLPDYTEIIVDVASRQQSNNREAVRLGIARKIISFDRWFFDGEISEEYMRNYETAKLMIRC